jgi:hypothetical protein
VSCAQERWWRNRATSRQRAHCPRFSNTPLGTAKGASLICAYTWKLGRGLSGQSVACSAMAWHWYGPWVVSTQIVGRCAAAGARGRPRSEALGVWIHCGAVAVAGAVAVRSRYWAVAVLGGRGCPHHHHHHPARAPSRPHLTARHGAHFLGNARITNSAQLAPHVCAVAAAHLRSRPREAMHCSSALRAIGDSPFRVRHARVTRASLTSNSTRPKFEQDMSLGSGQRFGSGYVPEVPP